MLTDQQISLQCGEKLREIATRQGIVPFLRGDLRKGHRVIPYGTTGARLVADTPYARAVHDGRPALTITPKRGKALHWAGARHPVRAVHQPARTGRPWLRESIITFGREGLGWLTPQIGAAAVATLQRALAGSRLLGGR